MVQRPPRHGFRGGAGLFPHSCLPHWPEHKDSYNTLVRDPVTALLAELEPRFGPGKVFRPNRDIRFSQDKSPYKTDQGAYASSQEGVGYYVQVSDEGLLVAAAATATRRASSRESSDFPTAMAASSSRRTRCPPGQ
ncbi:conserved hypothetical protein [Arthrobacter sp. Hiyo4]|nr:conserved hypothetical protein [Arthrobacter sp. Hiyo4]